MDSGSKPRRSAVVTRGTQIAPQAGPREEQMIPNAQRPALTEDPRIDRYRALLAQTAIFKGATPSALDDLARRLQVRTRPAAAIIVAHEDPGDAMFILVSGRAKVALFGDNGRELTLTELKPGDFFGEMSLLDDRPRS